MDFLELAKKRYSVRSFLTKKVEQEKLKIILEAGRVAPTGANMQPQELIVVQESSGRETQESCQCLRGTVSYYRMW